MDSLSRHYHQLVGLNQDWVIADVQLDVENRTLTLSLEFVGDRVVCPECGAVCSMKDHASERSWRHLDAMQFQTTLTARVPRCSCETCGVKTIAVPWAEKHSRFTLLFEAFAVEVLQASQSIQSAALLLGVLLRFSWLIRAGFQAEFSAEEQNSNSIVFKDSKASCCRLDGLDAAVESFGRSVADWCGEPCQDSIEARL